MLRSSGWRAGVAVLLATLLTLLASDCGGGGQASGSAAPTTSTPISHSATTAAAVDGCVASGQVEVGNAQGAVLGTGPVGVVLSNQSDQNLCGWLPFGRTLAGRGFRVLLHDYAGDPVEAIARGAAKLRSLGARTVFLIGASEGAKASLVAGTTVRPPVAGVVSISPEQYLQGTDMVPVAARLRVPVLYLSARDDLVAGSAPSDLYKATTSSPSRRLAVLPGTAHGTDLLKGPGGPRAQALVLNFLRKHER
jgi:pimeloyl-ACP methyl ester carboxylesterase